MRIVIITDSWPPVVSGVVRTLQTTIRHLEALGHQTLVISPDLFKYGFRLPTDRLLRMAVTRGKTLGKMITDFRPDAIHIATEGMLGLTARNWCKSQGIPFTTSYTTKLPEYMEARIGVPAGFGYPIMRWFHGPSSAIMVVTETFKRQLEERGFKNLKLWGRGVDLELFKPRSKDFLTDPRPIWMYSGRVDKEKNLEAFLDLPLEGTKYVVGDGGYLPTLRKKYPEVRFPGSQHGEQLARYYSAVDCFVFPSKTDTFGLVLVEALASGVPVAAFPVPGPLDVLGDSPAGVLDEDLESACRKALTISPALCRSFAETFDWRAVTHQFVGNLCRITSQPPRPKFLERWRGRSDRSTTAETRSRPFDS